MFSGQSCSAEMFSMPILIFLAFLCSVYLRPSALQPCTLHKHTETNAVSVFAISTLNQVVFQKIVLKNSWTT